MVAAKDVIDFEGMNYADIASGRRSAEPHYDPPTPVAELVEPLDADGAPFQLLWRKR
ncbi:hypothetical protein MOBUDSM44075_04190 [Mycolicibacterium obuense]|uniref:Uncharacterized protein n=2 Tax=Mycolicibacterium obuense TaxID=1807 RepID=A0A0J6VQT0_9MYCO|nr:hypothetical protein MOBUDSM44075_04190 [Mycolicibacterium obuense]